MMTDKKVAELEKIAWESTDGFKKFNRKLKSMKLVITSNSNVEELIRGRFKPVYKRLELCSGKNTFEGVIFVPVSYSGLK